MNVSPNTKRHRLAAIGITIAFFFAVAPTLVWHEYSYAPENLVVATGMEMRRGGAWLVPTLQGETRVAKPPLAAWITAASIHPQTMRDIDTLDRNVRNRGFFLLALEVRWPALLSAALLLLGVFELGRVIHDSRLGLFACAMAASSFFLLRFARYTTTDIQLALWVTWANVFLARAVLRGKWWSGCIGAGLAMGLAMLSKGPVALVQSVVPFMIYSIAKRHVGWAPPTSSTVVGNAHPAKPLLVGAALFVVAGCWWYAIVLVRDPNVLRIWFSEVTRIGATESTGSSIFTYLGVVGFVAPWTLFFIIGLLFIAQQFRQRTLTNDLLPLLLLIVPLLIMTLAKDRQDRYTLPMISAAALVCAIGLREYLKAWEQPSRNDRVLVALHWLILFGIAFAFPLIGATPLLKQSSGEPWFPLQFALIEAGVGATLLLFGIARHRTRPTAIITTTVVLMLITQAVYKGFSTSAQGRSEMKELAEILSARYPGGTYYNAHPTGKRPPTDLGVYLNRTIRWIDDPSVIAPTRRPTVLFMRQNASDPAPVPPRGWRVAHKAPRDDHWWWAFVLPPS